MKYLFALIFFIFITNSYSQDNGTLKHLLDSIPGLNFQLTPNMVRKDNKSGVNIIWAGKIDIIEIEKADNKIILIFYCHHHFFNDVSIEKVLARQINLKNEGDGDFTLSMISDNMTLEAARNIVMTFVVRSTNYILTVGKVLGSETKFGKKYIDTMTYSFYTFKQ